MGLHGVSWAKRPESWMFPWLDGKTQHIVGCPVDVIKSKDSPPSSSSPWAVDDWQLRDWEGKCQTSGCGFHFLPWPSAFSCCWRLAAGLDRSLVWPSPHFLLFSDRSWILWKVLNSNNMFSENFGVLLGGGQGWCFTELGRCVQTLRKSTEYKINLINKFTFL